jgi:hypothetical protein
MRWARQVVTETFAGPRLWRPREFQPTGHRVSPRGRAACAAGAPSAPMAPCRAAYRTEVRLALAGRPSASCR